MSAFKIEIESENGRAKIYSPYNPSFIKELKSRIGGRRWDAEEKCWSVPEEAVEDVREIMQAVYGRDDREPKQMLKIKIRVKEDLEQDRGPVVVYGKTLASARGRDSGARVGSDAVLLSGKIGSGGSARYWKSIVKAGAEFSLCHVPEGALEESDLVEILSKESESPNREALEEEKQKLLARLAEIEELLKA